MLRFNDNVNIDTSGELRTLKLRDGYYVVGNGLCIPVGSNEDACRLIKKLKK